MNNYNKWVKKILIIAGIVEIVMGLAHFAMPYFAYQSRGFIFLHRDELNFITLCVCAVGILLIAFGILTVFFSLQTELSDKLILYYAVIKSFLWSARIILEILYPVKIPLFYIEQPTTAIMPLLIFEWLLFVFSAVLIILNRNKMSNKAKKETGSGRSI